MAVKVADVPAVLARHGIPLDADADTLMNVLVQLGWRVTVEEGRVGSVRRHTVQASRLREVTPPPYHTVPREGARGSGPTPAAALALVLAKVLERET